MSVSSVWTVVFIAFLVSCIVFKVGWWFGKRSLVSGPDWLLQKSSWKYLKDSIDIDIKGLQAEHSKKIASLELNVKDLARWEEAWMSVCERLDAQGARVQELENKLRIGFPTLSDGVEKKVIDNSAKSC